MIWLTSSGRSGGWLVAHADEASHTGRIAHDIPAIFVHFHLDEDVAGEHAALNGLALALAHFDFFFGGDYHVEDFVLHPHRLDPLLDGVPNLVFIAGIAVNDVPLFFVIDGNLNAFAIVIAAHEDPDRADPFTPLARQQIKFGFWLLWGSRLLPLLGGLFFFFVQVHGIRIVVDAIFRAKFVCHYNTLSTFQIGPKRLIEVAPEQAVTEQPTARHNQDNRYYRAPARIVLLAVASAAVSRANR